MARPVGFLQVDVDGLWAVRACYGRPENDSFRDDPCWSEGLPTLTEIFQTVGAPASLFVVGRDLELQEKREAAKAYHEQGFELANHSTHHMIGITRLSTQQLRNELHTTDARLREIGSSPKGFRAPGYDVDRRVLEVAAGCGYLYDASVLPTFTQPLLRLADMILSRRIDRKKRQFGRLRYRNAPRRPYWPDPLRIEKESPERLGSPLLEIPVGVTPTFRLPLTASILLRMSKGEVKRLFKTLADRGEPVLLLLHAIDGVDCRQPIIFDGRRPRLGGFAMAGEAKKKSLRYAVEAFAEYFAIERADLYAERVSQNGL